MKNIILLGYKGTIGKNLFKKINTIHNVYTDENRNIKQLINKRFIVKNDIEFIINCIGIKDQKEFFFGSNFILPAYISKKLSEIDLHIKKKILYIQISSIGVNNPFDSYNLNEIKIDINKKQQINYNQYEFSKAAGDFIVINNITSLKNIKYTIIKPSNIIENKSKFILKLKLFLLIFPFRISKHRKIPITKISYLISHILSLLNKKVPSSNKIKNLYTRYSLSELTKGFYFLELLKPSLPLKIIKFIIKVIPNISLFISFKRILILIYLL